jgi:hypothetical protein
MEVKTYPQFMEPDLMRTYPVVSLRTLCRNETWQLMAVYDAQNQGASTFAENALGRLQCADADRQHLRARGPPCSFC